MKIFMKCIDQIFMRADIQCIREFLLNGVDCVIDSRTYEERLKIPQKKWIAKLREQYLDEKEFEEIAALIFSYGNEMQNVYMEIGLQIGAILASQVCQNIKASAI